MNFADASASWNKILRSLFLGGLICWGLLWGPAGAAPPPGKIPVVATIVPLADFCRHLGGDLVTVEVLIPPGASPHAFEPAPSVIFKANQARVFVYVGAGLEPWAERLLSAVGTKNLAVVEAARGVPLIREVGEHAHGGAEVEKTAQSPGKPGPPGETGGHAAGNPHIWLDPVLAQEICRKIAAALIQMDPAHRQTYEANLQQYLHELESLDEEIRQQVKTWSLHDFVCFHDAYSYFARRYGLREAGVIELAPGREPTPRHLREIVDNIRKLGLRVVFAEPQLSPRVAQVIAQEAGVKVLMLDPVGGRPPYDSDYLQMMRYNLARLAEAMK